MTVRVVAGTAGGVATVARLAGRRWLTGGPVPLRDLLEIVDGQRMCQPIVGRRKCLIEAALLVAPSR